MNIKKFSLLEDINLRGSKVTYNSFDIDPNLSFEEQEDEFREDLLQIEYGEIYIIDIGYCPESNPKGNFKVVAIKEYDWDKPIFKKKCKDVFTLKTYLQEAIDFVDNFKDTKLKNKIKKFRNIILKKIDTKSGQIVPIDLFLEPISKAKNTFIKILYHNIYAIEIEWHLSTDSDIKGYWLVDTFKIKVINIKNKESLLEREYDSIENLQKELQSIVNAADTSKKEIPIQSFKGYLLNNIDLKGAEVIIDEFNLNPNISYDSQVLFIKNPLLSLSFDIPEEDAFYLITVYYSEEFNPNAKFKIDIYKTLSTPQQIYEKETKDINTLKAYLQEAINLTYSLVKNK